VREIFVFFYRFRLLTGCGTLPTTLWSVLPSSAELTVKISTRQAVLGNNTEKDLMQASLNKKQQGWRGKSAFVVNKIPDKIHKNKYSGLSQLVTRSGVTYSRSSGSGRRFDGSVWVLTPRRWGRGWTVV
jgi:hypothetical protein